MEGLQIYKCAKRKVGINRKDKMKHREHDLQTACVRWFRMQWPKYSGLLFAIPNGAKLAGTPEQRARAWQRLQEEGARPGAPDLFLAVPSGDLAGLFIEMKTSKGRQSAEQVAFEADVLTVGYGYAVPRTLEQFVQTVDNYLKNGVY